MAERVAEWPKKYGIDGIDLDLEDGAGHRFKLFSILSTLFNFKVTVF